MRRTSSPIRALFLFLVAVAAWTSSSRAQQVAAAELPDAPKALQAAGAGNTPAPPQPDHTDPQTKRMLGIVPNFRAVGTDVHLPPQTVKEKFVAASEDSWDYSAFVLRALLAGEQDAARDTPEFGHGGVAYGRYLWHSFVDQTTDNYMVEFIVPVVTREDTRYYTLGRHGGGGLHRVGYALSRVAVVRNDAGKETFNFSEVVGSGAAAGISNFYYPRPERTFANTGDKWALNVGIDAAYYVAREFWPDISHWLSHDKNGPTTGTTKP